MTMKAMGRTLAVCVLLCSALGSLAPAREVGGDEETPAVSEVAGALASLERSLEGENLVNALYHYRSYFHVIGEDRLDLLARVGHVSLLDDMRHGKGWIRIEAAAFLARHGNTEALAVISAVALDPESASSLRRGAAQGLGRVDVPEARLTLEALMQDLKVSSVIRLAAMDALLGLGSQAPLPYLSLILRTDNQADRMRALRILGEHRARAGSMLWRAADPENPQAELLALKALAHLGDDEAIARLKAEFGVDPPVDVPTTSSESPANGALVAAGEESPQARRHAVDYTGVHRLYEIGSVLLEIGDPQPISFFEALVADRRVPYNKGDLANKIASVSLSRGRVLLRKIASESIGVDRIYAVRGLVALGETEGAAEILATEYRRANVSIDLEGQRRLVVTALSELDGPEAIPVLRECLEDQTGIVRVQAARALARRGNLEGLATLRGLLESAREIDSQQAAEALVEIDEETASTSRAASKR